MFGRGVSIVVLAVFLALVWLFVVGTTLAQSPTPEVTMLPPAADGGVVVMPISGTQILILAIAALVVNLGVAVYAIYRGTHPVQALTDFIHKMLDDSTVQYGLEEQFNRLSPNTQHVLRNLLSVADPISHMMPGDLDDEAVQWLRDIMDGLPAGTDHKPNVAEATPQGG